MTIEIFMKILTEKTIILDVIKPSDIIYYF